MITLGFVLNRLNKNNYTNSTMPYYGTCPEKVNIICNVTRNFSRFHGMIAAINNTLKTHKTVVTFPGNSFCYNVLQKLRDYGLLTGYHYTTKSHSFEKKFRKLHFSNKKYKLYRGFPLITVFINNTVPGYIELKAYPLTGSNFVGVSSKDIQSNIKTAMNKHSRRRHVLLTTTAGLRWDFEQTLSKKLGGKLLLTCIKRI